MIAAILSKGMATLKDIRESYGMGDLWDLAEVVFVNNYNEYLANMRE